MARFRRSIYDEPYKIPYDYAHMFCDHNAGSCCVTVDAAYVGEPTNTETED